MSEDIDLILDVEATCWDDGIPWWQHRCEVIEIGIYVPKQSESVLNADQRKATFLVQPIFNPVLTDFCKNLTSLTSEMLNGQPSFDQALWQIDGWCRAVFGKPLTEIRWASWGFYDLNILRANAFWHGSTIGFNPHQHINIKEIARRFRRDPRDGLYRLEDTPKRGGFSLAKALKFFDLGDFIGTAHRGVDDAYNIGRIWELLWERVHDKDIVRHRGHSANMSDSMMKKIGIADGQTQATKTPSAGTP